MKTKTLITVLLLTVSLISCVPSGQVIIYGAASPDELAVNLYSYNVNSRDNKQITDLKSAIYPSWSPDGTKIVFSSSDGLYFINNRTQARFTKFIDTPNIETHPIWSPDGTKIAFISQSSDDSSLYDLMVVSADGTNLVILASNLGEPDSYRSFSWSPDGKKLVFSFPVGESREIFTINSDGTNRAQITHLSSIMPYPPSIQPSWSPDGRKIAFVAWNLYVMNPDGTDLETLIDVKSGFAASIHPLWSPNGEYISCEDFSGNLYVLKADGTDIRRLTENHYLGGTSWSPDGYRITFMEYGGNSDINIYLTDVRTFQTIAIVKNVRFAGDLSLAWQP